jgi:hypothetical protein
LYDVQVTYLIDNESGKPWNGNLFAQLKRDASSDPSSSTATGTATYLGAALWTSAEPYKKVSMKDIDKGRAERNRTRWLGSLAAALLCNRVDPQKGAITTSFRPAKTTRATTSLVSLARR